jgi:hypothetical protein
MDQFPNWAPPNLVAFYQSGLNVWPEEQIAIIKKLLTESTGAKNGVNPTHPNAPQAHPKMQKGLAVLANPLLIFLEAATGLEPVNNGFADRSLATWVCRRASSLFLAENHRTVKGKFEDMLGLGQTICARSWEHLDNPYRLNAPRPA